MKPKQLIWLLGALVVLLGLAYLTGAFERNVSTVDVPEVSIPVETLEQVRIETPDYALTLQREGDRWRLTRPLEAAADSAAVARLLRELTDLKLASVVSTSPDRYVDYGVDDSSAARVSLQWPGGGETFVVGNPGSDLRSVYLRVDADPRVYATTNRLNVPRDLRSIRDKTVLDLPPSGVTAVAVETPDRAFEVTRGPDGWQVAEGGKAAPADSAAVARWLQRFAPLQADGFLDDVPPADVRAGATHRLAFSTPAGAAETLWMQQHDDAFAATTGTATYQLRAPRLDTLIPDPASLKAE